MIRVKDITRLNYCNAFMARFNGDYAEKAGKVLHLYVSYNTVIGIRVGNSTIFTNRSYSSTTVQHKYKFIRKYGGHIVDHSEFAKVCTENGVNPEYNGYRDYLDI